MVAEYNEKQKNEKVTMEVKVGFDEKVTNSVDAASPSILRNIGYLFLQAVCHQLDLKKFFDQISADRRFTFDPNEVYRFLVFARILDPSSKFYACNHFNQFYEQPNIEYQHIMRTLTLMNDHFDEYIEYLYNASSSVIKRDCSACYYDYTNFYFETENPDEDYVDDVTGEYLRGFRKYGFFKQHQPLPLLKMVLFMALRAFRFLLDWKVEIQWLYQWNPGLPGCSAIKNSFNSQTPVLVDSTSAGSMTWEDGTSSLHSLSGKWPKQRKKLSSTTVTIAVYQTMKISLWNT